MGWVFGRTDVGYYQPLGILYVATCLMERRPGDEVKVIDAASPDIPYHELEKRIRAFGPDVVGISTYTPTFIDALEVAKTAKRVGPNTHVCMGGHHLFCFPRETLDHGCVDSIVVGEGELAFPRLVDCLESGDAIEQEAGVFTRRNIDDIDQFDRADGFVRDISKLPWPDRGLLEEHSYYNFMTLDRAMTTIVSSRGCPHSCTFCPQGREPYRQRPHKDVLDEMEHCREQGYTDFFFAEDTFNISAEKVVSFCREKRERGLDVSWCCKARVAGLNYETLAAMRDAGCRMVNLGVETGSDSGLEALQKGTTTNEIRQVMRDCRRLGVKTFAYFMIGHPFETSERDVRENLRFLMSLKADYMNINPVFPVPFTPLFDEGVEKGVLSYEPWRQYVLQGVNFVPPVWEEHLSRDVIMRLRRKAEMRFYFRPGFVLRTLFSGLSPKQFVYMVRVAVNMIVGFLGIKIRGRRRSER